MEYKIEEIAKFFNNTKEEETTRHELNKLSDNESMFTTLINNLINSNTIKIKKIEPLIGYNNNKMIKITCNFQIKYKEYIGELANKGLRIEFLENGNNFVINDAQLEDFYLQLKRVNVNGMVLQQSIKTDCALPNVVFTNKENKKLTFKEILCDMIKEKEIDNYGLLSIYESL